MAYDPVTGHVLMFGGDTGAFPNPSTNQTWRYDGVTWTQLAPTASPTGKLGIQLVHDSNRGVFVMYGGSNTSAFGGASVNQTWEFDGAQWLSGAVPGPGARSFSKMVYDPSRRRAVLFGGYNGARGTFVKRMSTSFGDASAGSSPHIVFEVLGNCRV